MNILLLDVNHINSEHLVDSYGITPNWKTLKLKHKVLKLMGVAQLKRCMSTWLYVPKLLFIDSAIPLFNQELKQCSNSLFSQYSFWQ